MDEEHICPCCVIENQKLRDRLRTLEESRDEFSKLAWTLLRLLDTTLSDVKKYLNNK